MPLASDASTLTSVTASPMEFHDPEDLPIELKIPLPTSSSCSDQDLLSRRASEEVPRGHAETPGIREEKETPGVQVSEPDESRAGLLDGVLPMEGLEVPSIKLEDLACLVQYEIEQRYHRDTIHTELERLSLSCGLDARLRDTLSIAYNNMIDQYKTDDQTGFASLYEAGEQLAASCAIPARAVPDSEFDFGTRTLEDLSAREDKTVIHNLPPGDQMCIINFLNQIRTDPDFLADRISTLEGRELTSLTSSYHPAGVDLSILPNHSHGSTNAFSEDPRTLKLSRRTDSVKSFHHHDPYFTLIHGVFDCASAPGSLENHRRTEIWAFTCAKVITRGLDGCEEFIISTLDAFAHFHDWMLKPKLELFLERVLAEGSFVIDPSSQLVELKDPVETRNATYAIAVAHFFDNKVKELFQLISSEISSGAVPDSVLTLIHSTLSKVPQGSRELAKKFIVSRWFFASFLASVLVHPEVQGLMLTHYISPAARLHILKELSNRMQNQGFNVLTSSHHPYVAPEVQGLISSIIQGFEPASFPDVARLDPPTRLEATKPTDEAPLQQLMLSHWDVIGLIQALYPRGQTAVDAVNPPSTASSSTLRPGQSEFGSSEVSSFTPSYIGTPTSGATIISQDMFIQPPSNERTLLDLPEASAEDFASGAKVKIQESKPAHLQEISTRLEIMSRGLSQSEINATASGWAFFDLEDNGRNVSLNAGPGSLDRSGPSEGKTSHDYLNLKLAIIELLARPRDLCKLPGPRDTPPQEWDPLRDLLGDAMAEARSQYDFKTAHYWWKTLKIYCDLVKSAAPSLFCQRILNDVAEDLHESIRSCTNQAYGKESRMRSLAIRHTNLQTRLVLLKEQRKALRIKMWYASDVRHSSTYEEASLVTQALRAMIKPKRAKQSGGVTSWARQRLRPSSGYDRAAAQTLEALSAPKGQGGTTKLADDQIELTLRWLTKDSIENFCKGEERIHRFCYEVKKSIGKLAGPSLLESPVLWSSNLFKHEKSCFDKSHWRPSMSPPLGVPATSLASYTAGLRSPSLPLTPSPHLGHPNSGVSANAEYIGGFRVPPLSRGLGIPGMNQESRHTFPGFWSNYPSEPTSPPITPLLPNFKPIVSPTIATETSRTDSTRKTAFVEDIKKRLCSLMTSDLGYLLWAQGSETDAWINQMSVTEETFGLRGGPDEDGEREASASQTTPGFGTTDVLTLSNGDGQGDSVPAFRDEEQLLEEESADDSTLAHRELSFPFSDAYSRLLEKMSLTQDPYTKLQVLCQLGELVLTSLHDDIDSRDNMSPANAPSHGYETIAAVLSRSKPRTKTTSLEEVIANCTERRTSTLRFRETKTSSPYGIRNPVCDDEMIGTEDTVSALLSIFRDSNLRPRTLFRDLQYIAAFVPSSILDRTAQGKAFWDAGLAALAFKDDLFNYTIHRATELTNYHIAPKKPLVPTLPIASPLANTTLRDAAQLWLIAAKEGSPSAARELGLFYLTHPHLLKRVTMPFSRAKDVFRSVPLVAAGGGNDKETGALDPKTFAVVLHWMEIAANGGDREAKDFLRGTEEANLGR